MTFYSSLRTSRLMFKALVMFAALVHLNFQKHGNIKYASPHNSSRKSSQGKMKKSFLSFQSSYPSREPTTEGKQFLSTLKTFKEQKFQEQGIRPGLTGPNQMQHWAQNLRAQGDPNSYFSSPNISKSTYQLDCMWLIDPVHKNYPYILDRFHTSCPGPGPLRKAPQTCRTHPTWSRLMKTTGEASTSAPLLRGSVLQHHGSGRRAGVSGDGPRGVTSFIEPPNFNRDDNHNYNEDDENISQRSFEEHEQQGFSNWRSVDRLLSRTFYMDDIEGGKFDLPFDDIYDRSRPGPIYGRQQKIKGINQRKGQHHRRHAWRQQDYRRREFFFFWKLQILLKGHKHNMKLPTWAIYMVQESKTSILQSIHLAVTPLVLYLNHEYVCDITSSAIFAGVLLFCLNTLSFVANHMNHSNPYANA